MPRHLPLLIAALLIALVLLDGCAATTILSVALTVATGKGLTEHALSTVTGKDCNVLGSVMDPNRSLCEEPGSEATKGEFKGIFGGGEDGKPPPPRPVLVRLDGKLVYTMPPVMRAADIANAQIVRALPSAGGEAHPVLVRVKGKLIYTMAPRIGVKDIRGSTPPPR